jgi:hypothetical protein
MTRKKQADEAKLRLIVGCLFRYDYPEGLTVPKTEKVGKAMDLKFRDSRVIKVRSRGPNCRGFV